MPLRLHRLVLLVAAPALLTACAVPPRQPSADLDPDTARARIRSLMPGTVANAEGWAIDIHAALEALRVPVTTEHICGVLAVTDQESNFQVDPAVPGLPAIARREIEARAASHHVPKLVVGAALKLRSPDGRSYEERLDQARTERDLSDLFEDFTRSVPLGERLFGDMNPVRTGGPMQVSIAFAEAFAAENPYPYPVDGNIRHEVFSRRGGVYFGVAHLLGYPASYPRPLYRFADYNAGRYASRNAAFQNAVTQASGVPLDLDGDLLRYEGGKPVREASGTELAVRTLGRRLDLSNDDIRRDLAREHVLDFEETKVWLRVFATADAAGGKSAPRAIVPKIPLKSPKITRPLTTEWFADRVESRYQECLQRLAK